MAFLRPTPLLLLATLLAGTAACSDDEPGPPTTGTPSTESELASSPDPLEDDLVAQVRELRETVATARELLAEAPSDPQAADAAVGALTADERLAEGSPGVAPLFPGPLTSREETIDYGDALTRTLTAARAASGALGDRISQVLSDPIAGDLGIWQRDAEGLLDAVDEAARSASVEEAEAAVLELPGEGTRALAYALLAARAEGEELRGAYAERAMTHLDIVLRAIDDALGDAGAAP